MSNKNTDLPNPHLKEIERDFLYHLGFDNKTINLEKMFGDVRVVCMGGTKERMLALAKHLQVVLNVHDELVDLCEAAQRYAIYKVGPILCASHGIGMPSMSILLHEITKLVHYAKCVDPIFLRVGSSGGLGLEVGTVVVTKDPLNGYMKNEYELAILGERVHRPSVLSSEIYNQLIACAEPSDEFQTVLGNTMGADDFYEGQGRTDGAICGYSEEDKMNFLMKLHEKGARNIEMEAPMFGAFTNAVGIKAAIICVTFVDRLKGDQLTQATVPKHVLEMRPLIIVGRFIKKLLST